MAYPKIGEIMSSTRPDIPSVPAISNLLEGKVAIVTGASRGIGAAGARVFAQAGARVVLAARDEAALNSVVHDIHSAGGQALAVPTDVDDPRAVERLVQLTLETHGCLDAAFNNAGLSHMPTPLADLAVEDFDRVARTNLRGVFLAMKFQIRAMLENGGGAIVNMSSTAGLSGVRGMSAYVAAKHGIIGLTKSAALDYAGRGIRINALAPGPILTDRLAGLTPEVREGIARVVPMQRLGLPEDVGLAAAWLCSNAASFITGATIPVDGGRLAGGG
jgi:NAD(P)-dependent dehydrogenase (short-subunit alcohol dehydrogenase family)